MREEFYAHNCTTRGFGYATKEAASDTLPHPSQWSSTGLQVAGFNGDSRNNGDGTVTFTIQNTAGTHSFFYHIMPDLDLTIGLGRNNGPLHMKSVHQEFRWTEPIDKSKCHCQAE